MTTRFDELIPRKINIVAQKASLSSYLIGSIVTCIIRLLHRLIFTARQHLMGQYLLIFEASPSHSFRHNTLGMTTLDESLACRRVLDLTPHDIQKRQTSMTPVGFEPNLASELPPNLVLNRAVPESAYCTNSRTYNYTNGFLCNCIKNVVLCYQRKFYLLY